MTDSATNIAPAPDFERAESTCKTFSDPCAIASALLDCRLTADEGAKLATEHGHDADEVRRYMTPANAKGPVAAGPSVATKAASFSKFEDNAPTPSVQEQARIYREAGLRIVPIRGETKTPAVSGFTHDYPEATWEPEDFREGQRVAILCGPACGGSCKILGLDRDGTMTWEHVEQALGCKLPSTLSSKGDRHRYYMLPAGCDLRQANKLLVCPGGQLDTRPAAGGYLVEPWEWDSGFDPARIEEFPPEAIEGLRALRPPQPERARKERPPSEKQLTGGDAEIMRLLALIWQKRTTGDAALGAFGGVLYRAGVSADRAKAMAEALAGAVETTHPDPVGRVLQAYEGAHDLGWSTLSAALCENGAGLPEAADAALISGGEEHVMPSLNRPEVRILVVLRHVEQLIAESVDETPSVSIEESPNEDAACESELEAAIADLYCKAFPALDELPAPKPLDYLCEGLLIARDVRPASIACYPGCGKSTAGVELARAVATGTPAFGRFPCKQGRVLFVANEGKRGAHDGLLRSIPPKHWANAVLSRFDLLLSGPQAETAFALLERAAKAFDLIVIDSLNSSLPGLDENDARTAEPLGRLETLAAAEAGGRAAIVVLRHTGKGTPGKGGKDPMQAGRGSSAIDGRFSVQWLLTPAGELGSDRSVDWACTRNNDCDRDPARPFNCRRLSAGGFEVTNETSGQAEAKARGEAKETKAERELQIARQAICEAWWTGGRREISVRDAKQLALAAGVSAEAGRRALGRLVEDGKNPATRGPDGYAYRPDEKGGVLWGINPHDAN